MTVGMLSSFPPKKINLNSLLQPHFSSVTYPTRLFGCFRIFPSPSRTRTMASASSPSEPRVLYSAHHLGSPDPASASNSAPPQRLEQLATPGSRYLAGPTGPGKSRARPGQRERKRIGRGFDSENWLPTHMITRTTRSGARTKRRR